MNKRAEKQECVDNESNKIIFFGNRASEHESNPNKSPSKFYYFYHVRVLLHNALQYPSVSFFFTVIFRVLYVSKLSYSSHGTFNYIIEIEFLK